MPETRTLASFVLSHRFEDVPEDVLHEARRAVLNYVGCALGGAPDPAVNNAICAMQPFFGPPDALILGRRGKG